MLSEDTSKRVREEDKKGGSKQQDVVSGRDPPGSPPDPERALGQEPQCACIEQGSERGSSWLHTGEWGWGNRGHDGS